MSTTPEIPAAEQPAAEAVQPTESEAVATPTTEAADTLPTFDGPFDEERAKRKIAAMEADKAKLRERLAAYEKAEQEAREAQMSEVEKAQAAVSRLEATLAERDKELADMRAAEQRREILARHHIEEDDDVKALLDGVAADQLEARVAALVKLRGPARENPAEAIPGKPAPRLTAGHQAQEATGASDLRQLAKDILDRR